MRWEDWFHGFGVFLAAMGALVMVLGEPFVATGPTVAEEAEFLLLFWIGVALVVTGAALTVAGTLHVRGRRAPRRM